MKTILPFFLILFTGVLLAACAAPTPPGSKPTPGPSVPTVSPTSASTQPSSDVVPQVVPAARLFAAEKYGVAPDEVKIVKMDPVEWPNACIGAGQPGDICAQMITPGYQIQIDIKGKTYILNSDTGGKNIRVPTAAPTSGETNPVVEAARVWLANTLKLDVNAVQLISFTPQDWSDGCLGIHKPGISCMSSVVPGFKVSLQALGSNYEVRTDQTGKMIVMADQPGVSTTPKSPAMTNPVIGWKSGTNPCTALQIAGSQVAFGPCGSTPRVVPLSNPQRSAELSYFIKNYAAISAQTPVGEIILTGGGPVQPTAAQQRTLAEWAQLVYLEVSSSAPMPNLGLALTWHRAGGIAGFCDDLKIYRSGLAVTASCKGSQPVPLGSTWLSDAQLTPLFTWLDQLQSSDYKFTDPAVADAMTVTWMLSSSGNRPPTNIERQQILGFAAQVFASAK